MRLPCVTFDCAQTLVEVTWTPSRSVRYGAEVLGMELPPSAPGQFDAMFLAARSEYERANLPRTDEALHDFWMMLHRAWLVQSGLDPALAESFVTVSEEASYRQPSRWFRPYDDVLPCLKRLQDAGVRMAVLSNWDHSLHGILRSMGLTEYFEVIIASLEEGVEKPDPALFRLAFERMGVGPDEVVHIGDHPVDDVQGAIGVGCRYLHLCRGEEPATSRSIGGLDVLPEALTWSA